MAGLASLLVTSPAVLAVAGCTDLSETPYSVVTPDNFFRTEREVLGALSGVYSALRGTRWGYYNLSEISTDEMVVPTRGTDWFDNGRWLEIHRQGWSPISATALSGDEMNGTWNDMFQGIARANSLLGALEPLNVNNKEQIQAEIRALRAFYYYVLMDLFGGLPLVTEEGLEPQPRSTRREIFDFIEGEMLFARDNLPDSWPANQHGRFTKGAANAILASLYINAGVFTKDSGISATAYNSCQGVMVSNNQDACVAAVAAADAVLNSPAGYILEPDYHRNFAPDNGSSRENIFVIKHTNADGVGWDNMIPYRTLHYGSFPGGGWNGFSVLAETYFAYDTLSIETLQVQRLDVEKRPFNDQVQVLHSRDKRHQVFLAGLHRNVVDGEVVNYRETNTPIYFSAHFPHTVDRASEADGVRFYKWPLDPNRRDNNNRNDYAFFRLAEMYLIKAEGLNEQGQTGPAIAAVDVVRARAFDPPRPLSATGAFTRESARAAILRERHMELVGEAKRRQDLIRAGRYTQPIASTGRAATPARNVLMPIPQTQINANPRLTQNAGYN